MLSCPRCQQSLIKITKDNAIFHYCPLCKGNLVTINVLKRNLIMPEDLMPFWLRAKTDVQNKGLTCPSCGKKMSEQIIVVDGVSIPFDICTHCQLFWFDELEYETLPRGKISKESEADKDEDIRIKKAILDFKLENDAIISQKNSKHHRPSGFKLIFSILGFPYEAEALKTNHLPYATWFMAGLITLFYLIMLLDSDFTSANLGFIPLHWSRGLGLTVISSFFIHASIFHLIGNLYYLLLLGDNVEDVISIRAYLILLFAAHLAGLVIHSLGDPRSDIPLIGASGGISGIVAFYTISFPKQKIGFCFRFFYYFRWFKLPAWIYFGFWVLLQILGSINQLKGSGTVSNLGHLGGFLVGTIAALYVKFGTDTKLSEFSDSKN